MVRGIRGATDVSGNNAELILSATRLLLEQMTDENSVNIEDIAAVHFSSTPDLNSAFPAKAARLMGWDNVPLFGSAEIDVPDSLPRCIRILMLVNTDKPQDSIKHVYLGSTCRLRYM